MDNSEIIIEFFNSGVLQSIIPAILAILLVFLSKNYESNVNKKTSFLEKKRENFHNILSGIAKMIISIKSNYSPEHNGVNLVSEEKCDIFELEMKSKYLYLNDSDVFIINFIIEIIKKNNSWIYNYAGPDEYYSFNSKDISLIEYLYDILSKNFRNEIFNTKGNKYFKDIVFLKISFLYENSIKRNFDINNDLFLELNYNENSISDIIKTCNNNNLIIFRLIDIITEAVNSKKNISEYDMYIKQETTELKDLLK